MTAAPASPLLARVPIVSIRRLRRRSSPASRRHGRRRQVAQGEVLVQAGESVARIFVVLAGRIDVIARRPPKRS